MADTDFVTEGQVNALVAAIAGPVVTSSTVNKIVTMTQAAYDALGSKDSATIYFIVG